jgi:hypothetical protein
MDLYLLSLLCSPPRFAGHSWTIIDVVRHEVGFGEINHELLDSQAEYFTALILLIAPNTSLTLVSVLRATRRLAW